jgi:hypothetical protein
LRDPDTGDILQLGSNGWLSSDWTDYIPCGIWTDYIVPDDDEAPGPNGTFIRGALRPVFFMRDEFEAWFKRILGSPAATETISGPTEMYDAAVRVHAHRREAVKRAIREMWGQNGPDHGVTEIIRMRKINAWLTSKELAVVGEATIRRGGFVR